ncbi:8188_t:CDS:2 [Acaulospora morrowiae]|uniref:8188_t:CDS:1 n=1 Tax=Acaulospora morrowiae TaxID=94023 RepID=A0A9N9DE71_9GLOM|nr:8188_t:CDS:2 [Acaulospora morrowiae]
MTVLRGFSVFQSKTLTRSLLKTRTYSTKSEKFTDGSIIKLKKEPPHAPQREKTKFGHDFTSQAVYLFNLYYSQLHFNRLLFMAQHNNLNVQEQTVVRRELRNIGADLTATRGSILRAVIKQSIIYQNMAPLIIGPVCMISSNVCDEENPKIVSDILNILNKQKKLLLIGGKLDNSLLNLDDIKRVANLPGKKQLGSEMVGVLSSPAARMVDLLERNPKNLVRSLESLKSNLKKNKD